MLLITAKHIKKNFSERPLLEDVTLSINDGDKIGLVGVNGSGKSTLLKIIAGVIEEEGGEILRSNELRTAYLPQNPEYDPNLTVIEQAMKYVSGHIEEYVVKTYLTKVHMDCYDKPMGELSGGQRKRVALATVLCGDANLLILDEPTNHMDNDIIEWMEERLSDYKGAIFMITHDRYFLERITNHICEIEKGRLVSYEGNYEDYLVAKAERLQMAMANERKRANLYRKELKWIRWTAPARSTKQKARIQRFEQIETAKETFENPELELDMLTTRLGKKIIEINNISKSYNGTTYINDFSYNILRNDRIGIVGNNGCGKTTLLRMIMGQVEPDSGSIEIGDTVKIGYFSQESEEMNPNLRIIKFVEDIAQNVRTKDGYLSATQMLEKFLFPRYMHSVRIEKLSGGEKRRLYLLSVLMRAPNILILDEPTNDLDIDTLTVLEDYLDDFQGAVIIVSHDRYFLDRLVVRTFAFEEGGYIGHYTGGYSKYMNEKEEREAVAAEAARAREAGPASAAKPDGRNSRAPKVKFTYAEKKEFETIDEDIAKLEDRITEIDSEMMANASDAWLLADLSDEKTKLEEELMHKYERWEYLNELAEKIARGERVQQG
ncbi:MAG: ABC-F family ATP-binding cassette domain-containing protein [Firmicutes bacterium]|nr:ABC-F family ATP-binding cassette domain-containing protein [Bacillota bacterium]